MKILYLISLLVGLAISTNGFAQQPTVLRTDLTINPFYTFENVSQMVRLAYSAKDQAFYAISSEGTVYRLTKNGSSWTRESIGHDTDHQINLLQGLAVRDGVVYIVGNHVIKQGVSGYGLVMKGIRQANGNFKWTTVMKTDEHQSSKTLYDHSFSGIAFSPDGQSMFIASGSRTDHGEIKSNDGLYPTLREIPLTSAIFKIPATSDSLILHSDSTRLAPFVYIRGVRNAFDLAYAPNGDLFSVENSGDRSDPEEMNWIRSGFHYGFPWEIGGNSTPQQSVSYDPNTDKLVNKNYDAWKYGGLANDPTYPKPPKGPFQTPIRNLGPDADKYINPTTGTVMDASDAGTAVTTFTGHRAPVGLVFDGPGQLGGEYTGMGFVLSYQAGTADYGPMNDPSQDLLMLKLKKNAAGDNYDLNAYQIAKNFTGPTDAELVGNKLYVLQLNGQVWEISFPMPTVVTALEPNQSTLLVKAYPNPTTGNFTLEWPKTEDAQITLSDLSGRTIRNESQRLRQNEATNLNWAGLSEGMYFLRVQSEKHLFTQKVLIQK